MTLWKLEWLRIWRTQRWLILGSVYGVFGLLGPLTVRYLPEIIDRFGGTEVVGELPPMMPADGITQYVSSAQQFGLLAVAFVGAAALAFDAHCEMAIFLRTRASVRDIFIPRLGVNTVAAIAGFVFGVTLAYVGTGLLLEWLDLPAVVVGSVLQSLYLIFAVVVIGVVSSVVRSVAGTALISLGVLIIVGVASLIPPLAPWLPSDLLGALDALIRGSEFEYWRSIVVTAASIVILVPVSIARLERRET
ncbi:MAG: hypothetical protein BMS9Abin20_0329 [Acidimicrobiia bacterium]|nr:MAG: hypothetical protein BMS9Abin20_0329 [Acidimicrobiia bacterium]